MLLCEHTNYLIVVLALILEGPECHLQLLIHRKLDGSVRGEK